MSDSTRFKSGDPAPTGGWDPRARTGGLDSSVPPSVRDLAKDRMDNEVDIASWGFGVEFHRGSSGPDFTRANVQPDPPGCRRLALSKTLLENATSFE